MNEYVSRLLEPLQRVHVPDRRAELLARVAGIQARLRDFDGARKTIDGLRATYGDGRNGLVTVSIMLAEGMVHYYERFESQALDRFTRAQVLSVGMRYEAGISLSAAWKSNYHFEFEQYAEMVQSLRLAVRHAAEDNYDAIARFGVVLFNAFSITGNASAAQYWFMRAREAAAKNEDRLTIEGLLYSRAAFMVTRARAENCLQAVEPEQLRALRMEVSSARNFQVLSKMASLPEHLRLWDARLRILEGDYVVAEKELLEIRGEQRFASHNFNSAFIDLEIAFCQAASGRIESALKIIGSLKGHDFGGLDVDEQLVAAWIKRRLAELDERFGDLIEAQQLCESAARSYESMMNGLADEISEFAH